MPSFDNFKSAARQAAQQAAMIAQQGREQGVEFFRLEKECERAAKTLKAFLTDPSNPSSALNSIPKQVLAQAHGLAIFTVVKAGFMWSGKAGSGIVIARLPDGTWSAPSCIMTGSVGFGFQIGADISDVVVVLNNAHAVNAFAHAGNITIGGSLQAAAGPLGAGTGVNSAILQATPLLTYAKSKGLYAGFSLEGTLLIERTDANKAFYGQYISGYDILNGRVPPPAIAADLYETIESAEEATVPPQVENAGLYYPEAHGRSAPRTSRPVPPPPFQQSKSSTEKTTSQSIFSADDEDAQVSQFIPLPSGKIADPPSTQLNTNPSNSDATSQVLKTESKDSESVPPPAYESSQSASTPVTMADTKTPPK